jgi:hypothetical protein
MIILRYYLLGDAARFVFRGVACGMEKKAVHNSSLFSDLSRFHRIHVRNDVYLRVVALADLILLGSPGGNGCRIHPGAVGLLRNPQSAGIFAFILGPDVPAVAAVDSTFCCR